MKASKVWWEKTVEYTYVMTMGIDHFVAPLDGKQEAAADAIVALNATWSLVEFKRSRKQFSSERRKYPEGEAGSHLVALWSYANACRDRAIDGILCEPHVFVYGTGVDTATNRLRIEAVPYWGTWVHEAWTDRLQFADFGARAPTELPGSPLAQFNEYVELLLWAKADGKPATSAGGLAMVVGLSPSGELLASLSLEEYAGAILPHAPAPQVPQPVAPSPGQSWRP